MPIGTSSQRLNLIRKHEVDSLKGSLIPNSKDRTLDLGNWHIKRNLRGRDNSCNLTPSFANLFGDSLRLYVLI